MNNEYDISKAFERIEETLIKSMSNNLGRHLREETKEGMNWSAWQAEQLKSLEIYKKRNKKRFKATFSNINSNIKGLLRQSRDNGKLEQEKMILEAIDKGNFVSQDKKINKLWNIYKRSKNKRIKEKQISRIYDMVNQSESSFFKIDEKKLNALINETTQNLKKAETSILRYTNDKYRKIIYDAQVYANTGSGTPQQAIDMATHDFLQSGINNIEYANGARVNIKSYVEMAIKTANSRAHMQGEGEKRDSWGVHTVLVPNRGGGCPYCVKFQGRVFIDDVWSSGTAIESTQTGYPLLSSAIKERLFHPNCKDTTVTYFPEINSEVIPPTDSQIEEKRIRYNREQKLNYINRNIEKYKRLELGSLDNDNIEKYHNKRLQWEEYKKQFKKNTETNFIDVTNSKKDAKILSDEEQRAINQYISSESYKINDKLRNEIELSESEKILRNNLDSALAKCNNYEGNIVRTVEIKDLEQLDEFIEKNKLGNEIKFNEYLSFSNKNDYNENANIFIYTKSKTAKDLRKYNPQESELLYKRNSKFLVENIIKKDNKYYILWRDVNE